MRNLYSLLYVVENLEKEKNNIINILTQFVSTKSRNQLTIENFSGKGAQLILEYLTKNE